MPAGTLIVSVPKLGAGNQLIAFEDLEIGVKRQSQKIEPLTKSDQFEEEARRRIALVEAGREKPWW